MLKMYLQVILTLGSFFGALSSMTYVGLTYTYVYQMTPILKEKGQTISYDWRFWAAILTFLICLAVFICCIFWVNESQRRRKEKMLHLNSFRKSD